MAETGGSGCSGCLGHLVREAGGTELPEVVHLRSARVRVGRLKRVVDVALKTAEKKLLSRVHCVVSAELEGHPAEAPHTHALLRWRVADAESLNGIAVNGIKVLAAPLDHGDTLAFGRYLGVPNGTAVKPSANRIIFRLDAPPDVLVALDAPALATVPDAARLAAAFPGRAATASPLLESQESVVLFRSDDVDATGTTALTMRDPKRPADTRVFNTPSHSLFGRRGATRTGAGVDSDLVHSPLLSLSLTLSSARPKSRKRSALGGAPCSPPPSGGGDDDNDDDDDDVQPRNLAALFAAAPKPKRQRPLAAATGDRDSLSPVLGRNRRPAHGGPPPISLLSSSNPTAPTAPTAPAAHNPYAGILAGREASLSPTVGALLRANPIALSPPRLSDDSDDDLALHTTAASGASAVRNQALSFLRRLQHDDDG